MIPYHFTGEERVLEAPKGYDHEANGECVGLPVIFMREGDEAETIIGCTSVWKPTPEQLATLNRGGGVVLHVLGRQPPVMLDAVGPEQLLVPA